MTQQSHSWAYIHTKLSFTKKIIRSVAEVMEKLETLCVAGENVNWYSQYGEQFGNTLEIYT